MALLNSDIHRLSEPESFFWATGMEDTFITAPCPKTGRTLDEYELTQHYSRWNEDLSLVSELGIHTMRYGIPWHQICPEKGKWNWQWADQVLQFQLAHGIDPIVDLVHYGLPPWLEGAYLNPDYPRYVADFAAAVAERYRGNIYYYTPLNEPRITAWYCGRLGWWPPHLKGWRGFLRVMVGVCQGICQTVRALKSVDPEITAFHVDATDLYEALDSSLIAEAGHRQEIVFLALDLITGKVQEGHSLFEWLHRFGVTSAQLDWFQENAITLDILGINLYPMFSQKLLLSSPRGMRIRMPYASADIVRSLSRMYFERYRVPLFISETASVGSVARRKKWLVDSVDAVRFVREEGIPLIGYTWWPMLALITWAYRQGAHAPAYYLKQMGLWDLDPDPQGNLDRIRTELVDDFRILSTGGTRITGKLKIKNKEWAHVS